MFGHNKLAGHYKRQTLKAEVASNGASLEPKAGRDNENESDEVRENGSSQEDDGFIMVDHSDMSAINKRISRPIR